ncbi:hypothetical protein QV06_07375 [Gallibacterium genomosp. 3]|uniref:DUF2572 family protein n=1 Tax=Gallibacterium genomosp. 3 TaxID=505345 RepID=A0A1A7PR99_9PAST|nr:DUF2572 family protein [Gallibacterium genomosp. 3]OBX04271.1 hypothetical protein QV06_07375 [Gallibacterium genomosp. 3]
MRTVESGNISLFTLLLLTSVGLLLLWLIQDSLLFSQRGVIVRNHYLDLQGRLWQQYRQQRESLCQGEPPSGKKFTETLHVADRHLVLNHYIDCEKNSLFLQTPTQAENSPREQYLNPKYEFPAHQVYAEPIYTVKRMPKLWIIDQPMTWHLTGNLYGVVISNAPLTITGVGKIIGTVISDQPITMGEQITIDFDANIVQKIVEQFSYWEIAEGGWHDF